MASKALFAAVVLSSALAVAEPLVGPTVGNADALVSEATKLYNQKAYPKASELFLKATRANPANVPVYLQLGRAYLAAKKLRQACYAYRVFLKHSPDNADRKKAQAESDQCERQLKTAKGQPPDLTQKFVETRAAFFAALEKREIVGPQGAEAQLATMVKDGYLGPDLGDMAQKLGTEAIAQADDIHKAALANEKIGLDRLKLARPLYQAAGDVGASPTDQKSRVAFLDGLASLQEKEHKKAESHFSEAARLEPANKEYAFFRALALFQAGDRPGALKVLERELPDDPRTATLRTAQALNASAESGAQELEKLLFSKRYPPEK